jgi:hypothetical protein
MMTDSKHTPGPWTGVLHGEMRTGWRISPYDRLSDPVPVAHVYGHRDNEESCANARLIAAAPALLEALEAATHILEAQIASGKSFHNLTVGNARAAIARAKGEK